MSALGRALAVIDAVLQYPHPVSMSDLVERLGEPRATVHRWLRQLEKEGLLLRDPCGHMGVGPRLSALSLAALRSRNQGAPVRALLQAVVDEIGESCSIGMLDGHDYTVIDLCESPRQLRSNLAVGSRAPAHCMAGGKIMLVDVDEQWRRRLLGAGRLEARTPRTITRRGAFQAELLKVRKQGFAVNDEESLPGVTAVAVPIRDANSRTVAALTVHGPKSRLSLAACRRHAPRLQRAAERISRIWFPRRPGRGRN